VALARLDSLQGIVHAEEARVRASLGNEANWDRLARAWFQVGDHDRAAKCLERARKAGGREFDTMLLSGRVARSEGRFAEAIEWLERAVRTRAADRWERARTLPGSGAPARTGLLEVMRRAGNHPYRVSGRGRERLHFAAEGASGAMVVAARLNGRGPFLLRIDAGSPEVVLGRSLAHELGLVTVAGDEPGEARDDRAVRFDYAALDSLTLGATTLHQLPVAISDHPGLGAGFRSGASPGGVHGTLGFEALRLFRFCIDAPDSTLWLEPPGAAADTTRPEWAPAAAHRLPLLLRGTHLLVVHGRVNSARERPFLLDTGSPGIGLAAPASTIAEAAITLDTTRVHTGRSAAGPVNYLEFPVGRLCLGAACQDSLTGTYGTFPPRLEHNPNFRLAGMVQSGFLSRYRLGVDLSRRQVWLVEP
jgi:hypothetical protein